jgi:acyl carrier protein
VDRSQLTELVRDTVAEVLGLDPNELAGDTNLLVELQVDSLELMVIGSRLETALHTRLEVRELTGISTVDDAVDLIVGVLNGQA